MLFRSSLQKKFRQAGFEHFQIILSVKRLKVITKLLQQQAFPTASLGFFMPLPLTCTTCEADLLPYHEPQAYQDLLKQKAQKQCCLNTLQKGERGEAFTLRFTCTSEQMQLTYWAAACVD